MTSPESSDTQAESFADPLNLFEEKTYNNGESSNRGLERCCEVSDIELFTEDQALALSSDLAPPPHPSPLSPVSKLSLFLSLPVCSRSSLLTGEGERGQGGAKSYRGEEAWSSINHSILSV